MRAKQVLAKVFASAMVFSTLFGTSVMADEIEGGTIYIDKEVIDVTLPTTASQKFYIDPQGLIAVGKSGGTDATSDEGTVVGAFDMYAINNSSIPLALSVSYKLVDSDQSTGVTIVSTTADDGADIQGATTNTIAVIVSAVEDQGTSEYTGHVYKDGGSGTDITATDNALTDADDVYATAAGAPAAYFMTNASYKVKLKDGKTENDAYDSSAYEYVRDEDQSDASRVKLSIGGYCSKDTDWSDYAAGTKTLKLDVTFKFNKVTLSGNNATVDTANEVEAGPKVTFAANGEITISGLTTEKTLNAITDVVVVSSSSRYPLANSTATTDLSGYVAATKSGTIKYTLSSAWSQLNGSTLSVEVTLSDSSKITSNSAQLGL